MQKNKSSFSKINFSRQTLAFCIRKFSTKVLTPLTGFLQRKELQNRSEDFSLCEKGINSIIHWLSWCCHGAITLAYPNMRYNPVEARLQEAQWEWASAILKIPPKKLKDIATEFLIKQQKEERPKESATADTTKYTAAEVEHRDRLFFTILICFHHHLDYFKRCLDSIQEAIRHSPSTQVEVLIINDDPTIDLAPLLTSLDASLREKIVFRSHSENGGICHSLNEGITHAQGEWLLYLDCDDLLDPSLFPVLEKTIHQHPGVRFISSRAGDIDTDGDILFWRLRSENPHELIKNNFADHLKVIKKELHQDLGLFKQTFEGCQDYEFALRTAIQEPLLFIPDYLYRYRWHNSSQTVSQNKLQNLTAMRIRQTYMLAIYWLTQGTEMIQWSLTGPYADEWKTILTPHKIESTSLQYQIHWKATRPYAETFWKLLLVEIATIVIDRYREKNNDSNIVITL